MSNQPAKKKTKSSSEVANALASSTTTSTAQKKPGTWWFWYYKDALKTNSEIPSFSVEGRKSLLSYILGTRRVLKHEDLKTSTSSSIGTTQVQCLIFFPKADHSTDQFAAALVQSFKSSVVLSKQKNNIHIFITCPSLENFDQNTKNIPSGVNVWADVNGAVADKFGMRPLIQDINLNDLLGTDEKKKSSYSKQTVIGMFFAMNGKIVKSPAFQPKLQTVTLDTMKSVYDFIEKCQGNISKITAPDSYAADLTENDLKTLHSAAWNDYQRELNQMNLDLGLGGSSTRKNKTPSAPKKTASTKTSKTSTVSTKKKNIAATSTKLPPQRLSKL
ncbi:hypothetical protein FDP41_002799 [Naegleria fowleri]|uniref:Uncharacterized protein n=1 Tax=Naegleria fowleri TaxID=5763 RepID=A0A6A5BVJ8_NAEFO|nr:uncharacterized protein FDP41_002799 [Naegleria fowleri]KAF0978284.1 hypothetical protein FDP41_002799 [Naegleria fowleri]CAG4710605.1 unnamed protein product [Naegleria fowleri]